MAVLQWLTGDLPHLGQRRAIVLIHFLFEVRVVKVEGSTSWASGPGTVGGPEVEVLRWILVSERGLQWLQQGAMPTLFGE